MKVVCDACQAKYQIPDERVAGRKLKIRCRKCGETIVIRGDQGAADRATAESLPPSSVVEWHVSLQGDQHGPYPPEQMAEMLRGGQLSWDAYVWRDSYADWRLAGDSDTLVRAVASVAAGATTTDDTPTRMVQDPSPSQPVVQAASVVVAEAATPRVVPAPQSSIKANGNGARVNGGARGSQPPHVFAAAAISAAPTPQVGAYQAARVSAEAALTGERHEDSVLFAANKLASTPAIAQARGGYAAGEGSGLIDIRALAALARSNPTSTPQTGNDEPRTLGKRGSDEVSRLANQTGAFGNLDSLSPIDYPPRAQSNALPIAILGGSAMIAVAGVIAVYLLRTPPTPATVAVTAENAEVPTAAQPHAAAAVEDQARAAEPTRAPAAAEPAPAAEPAGATAHPEPTSAPSKGASRISAPVVAAKIAKAVAPPAPTKRAAGAEPKSAAKTAQPKNEGAPADSSEKAAPKKEAAPSIDDLLLDKKPEPTKATKGDDAIAGPAPAKTKEPSRGRSIDELLEEAVPAKEAAAAKKVAAAEAAGEALPETPSRDQVLAAMRAIDGEVQACAQGQALESPTANVLLTVAGSNGRVSSARVTGVVGAVGSCIANAVRNANFPKFAKAQFTLNFPFKLKK
jgi:predicted Zn finger-like uncharacterized protein